MDSLARANHTIVTFWQKETSEGLICLHKSTPIREYLIFIHERDNVDFSRETVT
ncbi:MAG: hypothetical protein KatS3mg130_0677 [Candidatus Sumerlaea sp.]|nr:MAG: hypothetical protein KatS3mg130_0677 [Candidatus Sumerlaea sp.]